MKRVVNIVVQIEVESVSTEAAEGKALSWAHAVIDDLRPKCPGCRGARVRRQSGAFFENEDPVVCWTCDGSGQSGEHPFRPCLVKVSVV
mgnify:CR=1 FL=1